MSAPPFARARSAEQREERRDAILGAASAMLDEVRVADLTLNELARRVGLAKSNVLRYFESREAILLDLYDREQAAWLDDLEAHLPHEPDIETVAAEVAEAASRHPRFCELTSASSSVLEHNVSGEVAAGYKRAAIAHSSRLARLTVGTGDLEDARAVVAIAAINLVIGGMWAASRPSEGMALAYREHPELTPLRVGFVDAVRELVATTLTGLRYRMPESSS